MARSPHLYYCDRHEIPLPPGHRFPIRKYRLLRETLEADGFYRLTPAPRAAAAVIEAAHDPDYVARFLAGTLDPRAMRRIGFPWSEGLVNRTLASVGGTLAATDDALQFGFGGTLAGGTHHAFPHEGAGFCVFNDIAISMLSLLRSERIHRAAVIDLDVHQGDGTAVFFERNPDVLTLSIHGANNFPFRKQHSKIDIDLPDGTEDDAYLDALAGVLPRVFDFGPEIVFYQSGVDGLAADTLGRLALTPAGLIERDRAVFSECRKRGVPVAVTLGGGYAEPIELTVEAHANTFRAAAERPMQAVLR